MAPPKSPRINPITWDVFFPMLLWCVNFVAKLTNVRDILMKRRRRKQSNLQLMWLKLSLYILFKISMILSGVLIVEPRLI